MAFTGQVLDNPISGERITFRKTSADTDGDLLVIDLELSPQGQVPGAHVHPNQEERFEVLSGVVKFRRGLKTVVGRPGDIVVVPPGAIHRFTNDGSEPARVRVEVRPALRMEELFETAVALAREGRTNMRGMPHPLDLALFMRNFDAEVKAPLAPAGVVRALMAPLSWLARHWGPRRPIPEADRSCATLSTRCAATALPFLAKGLTRMARTNRSGSGLSIKACARETIRSLAAPIPEWR